MPLLVDGSGIILIRKEPHEGGSIKTGTSPFTFAPME